MDDILPRDFDVSAGFVYMILQCAPVISLSLVLFVTVVVSYKIMQYIKEIKRQRNHEPLVYSKNRYDTRYTACTSPECVRCHRYQMIRNQAKHKLGDFCQHITDSHLIQRLTSAVSAEHPFTNKKQQPNVFFIPTIKSKPWWDRSSFTYNVKLLETNADTIRKEFMDACDVNDKWTRNLTETGSWATFYFYNQGNKIDENCKLCPKTIEIIQKLPDIMSGCIFGNALFSVMYPGTEITEHYGPTNARIRCHLGLNIPEKCYLTVGGETRQWQEGRCLIFDDSYLHNASHQGNQQHDSIRAVLVLDLWHPDFTPTEKDAISFAFGKGD